MDPQDIEAAAQLGGISALAAACRTILSEEDRTFGGFFCRFILGVFTGMMVGWALKDQGYSLQMQNAIVGASALAAKELLLAIIKIAETLRDNSASLAKSLLKKRKD